METKQYVSTVSRLIIRFTKGDINVNDQRYWTQLVTNEKKQHLDQFIRADRADERWITRAIFSCLRAVKT